MISTKIKHKNTIINQNLRRKKRIKPRKRKKQWNKEVPDHRRSNRRQWRIIFCVCDVSWWRSKCFLKKKKETWKKERIKEEREGEREIGGRLLGICEDERENLCCIIIVFKLFVFISRLFLLGSGKGDWVSIKFTDE